ncbi:hypothetical protein [Paraburkholderia sediminicola]|uniref:hypothetical protein n=2 Tax=Paraburkholderia TaxID=1822464 RepID=UPI0038BDA4DC
MSSPTTSSNGAALLAAYNPPAAIVADVVQNYTGPAFSGYDSAVQARCASPSIVSSTVVVAPDVIVFSAGASVKAQELAADLTEQAVTEIRTKLNLPTTGTAFDGTNRIELCVDTTLGQSDGETGTSLVGQTGSGVGPVMQLMSADAPAFDIRYPGASSYNAPVGTSYYDLFRHETTHAALFSLSEPFTGLETWFQEGMATTISQLPMPAKATVLGYVSSNDLISANNANTNGNVYPAYEATIGYLTSNAAGALNFGLTNIPAFVTAFKQNAIAVCGATYPQGNTPPAYLTVGMPAGQMNQCSSPNGEIDPRLETVFDQTFNATFKDSNGQPLLLHTTDSANSSLEATLYSRLNGFLQ